MVSCGPCPISNGMNTTINIRTDKKVREKAKKVFSALGLSTSAGINMFLHQVIAEKGLPFVPTADPKKIRERWDKQVEEALESGKRYKSAKVALRSL
jgi:addiction module RelB/DinJ family antitoxin